MTAHTIWLASYPKSGNTWIRALLAALEDERDQVDINALGQGPIASGRGHVERWSGLVTSDLTDDEVAWLRPRVEAAFDPQLEGPRYRKIHDALDGGLDGGLIVAPKCTLGAVYIVRDPRDVAVSFAHHSGRPVESIVDQMSDHTAMLNPEAQSIGPQVPQMLRSWSEHVRGWLDHDLFPVVVVRYEDLHADTTGQLARVAALAGLHPGEASLARAAEAAGFARLRGQEDETGFRERPQHHQRFFRRGEQGAWRSELAEGLVRRIEEDHGEVMRRLGYL